MKNTKVFWWVHSSHPDGTVEAVEMFYKGKCDRSDEGKRGYDVKGRPVDLGEGEYTVTVGGGDVQWSKPDNLRR